MAHRRTHPFLLFLGIALMLSSSVQAQSAKKKHSAKAAGIMSIVPGAGQIYNGKWWKVPIIYAGIGGIGYMAYTNYQDYQTYLTAYKLKTGNLQEDETPSELSIQLSEYYQESQLQRYKEAYRRDFELYCIILAAWYGLNIVDALVDGHLYSYDISDDLSLHIDPVFSIPESPCLSYSGGRQTGLTFSLNF